MSRIGKAPIDLPSGVEITYASTLVGHHVLTVRALEHGLLAPNARIVARRSGLIVSGITITHG